jgi:predicted dehydrogenase
MTQARKLRFGMIGGGRGAFIGGVHRIAAQMDGQAELVAGAFSSDGEVSRESGRDLLLAPDRVYASYEAMAEAEAAMPVEQRLDFVTIVTPNHLHFAIAQRFLEQGFNVVCDKPVALTRKQAEHLRDIVQRSGKIFMLTHNYTGNAMVKEARHLVRAGTLGRIRKVVAEYSQGWLANALEQTDHKQARWRTDPSSAGPSGCVADIGIHASNLVRYITGLALESLCAELTSFGRGRRLDDDSMILVRFAGGAKGVVHCSQIAIGEENNLNIRVFGDQASLEWRQEEPDTLLVKWPDRPTQILRRGNAYLSEAARQATRIPPGHPEGYLESFGNLYREAFRAIKAEVEGRAMPENLDFPTIEDGVEGMRFIESAVESARRGGVWVAMDGGRYP